MTGQELDVFTSIVLLTIHQAGRVLTSKWAQNGKYSGSLNTPECSTMGHLGPSSQPAEGPSAQAVPDVADDSRRVKCNELSS